MDSEDLHRTAAERRAKNSLWGGRLFSQPPLEGGSRKWIWGVAGVALLLLVTFVSGVRVGKELGRPFPKREASIILEDKAGQKVPFRIVETGKGSPREGEGKAVPVGNAEKVKPKTAPDNKAKEPSQPTAREAEITTGKGGAQPVPVKAPAAAKTKYTLQVAALNSAEEAKELVGKLKSRGYEAYAVTGTAAAKGTLHRVRIGSFPSLQEARQFAVEFEKKEKIKTIITNP